MKKFCYDKSLINTFAIGDIKEGVGRIVGFKADKIQIAYDWGWIEVLQEEVKIVDRYVQYRDRKTQKVLLEEKT